MKSKSRSRSPNARSVYFDARHTCGLGRPCLDSRESLLQIVKGTAERMRPTACKRLFFRPFRIHSKSLTKL